LALACVLRSPRWITNPKETDAMLATSTLPILGEYDYRRLRLLLRAQRYSATTDRAPAEALKLKLEQAVVVPQNQVPSDIVTLFSTVRFAKDGTGEEHTVTIVFPGESRFREDCVSALAPVGLSLLGRRLGTSVDCTTPEGEVRLLPRELVFQPESAGAYYV
jgi:regulator of nucleoside diphosphate kinase